MRSCRVSPLARETFIGHGAISIPTWLLPESVTVMAVAADFHRISLSPQAEKCFACDSKNKKLLLMRRVFFCAFTITHSLKNVKGNAPSVDRKRKIWYTFVKDTS